MYGRHLIRHLHQSLIEGPPAASAISATVAANSAGDSRLAPQARGRSGQVEADLSKRPQWVDFVEQPAC